MTNKNDRDWEKMRNNSVSLLLSVEVVQNSCLEKKLENLVISTCGIFSLRKIKSDWLECRQTDRGEVVREISILSFTT
jgi:hypothetical protein